MTPMQEDLISALYPITCFVGARSPRGLVNPLDVLGGDYTAAKTVRVHSSHAQVGTLAVSERVRTMEEGMECRQVVTGSLRLPDRIDTAARTIVTERLRLLPGGAIRARGGYVLFTKSHEPIWVEYEKFFRPRGPPSGRTRGLLLRLRREKRSGWMLSVTISAARRRASLVYDGRSELDHLLS